MRNILARKTVGGFYVPAVSLILSIIISVSYGVGFRGTQYASTAVVALPLVASVLFFALSVSRWTQPFAAAAAGLLQFAALLAFITDSYMYLTEVFYGGVSLEGIAVMNKAWPTALILLITNIVLCNIGVYHRQERSEAA